MSMKKLETITCPKCGKEIQVTVWQSLNADLDPDAKQRLLDGTLFSFSCEHCGYHSNLDYPVLYHDMSRKALVYYASGVSADREMDSLNEVIASLGISMDGYRIRFVSDRNQVREKALIFDNGLDDRVVEVCKIFMTAEAQNHYPGLEIHAVYFDVNDGEFSFAFFGSRPLTALFPMEAYASVRDSFAAQLNACKADETVIDHDWAMEFLQKISGQRV